jgi:phage terminase large subunit-like protein
MTAEERSKEREFKAQVVEELQANRDTYLKKYAYALAGTDQRMQDYVCQVIDNPDDHNLYEHLKIRRFFLMLDKWEWKPKRAKKKIRLFEKLKFSGTSGRRCVKLSPVQVFSFANIYGLARPDGRRLIRTVYKFVPRKYGKTTEAAGLAVDDLLFGDHNAEAYVGANSYDQAKKCFNEIRGIMKNIDPRQKHFRINRETIKFRDGTRESLAQCLTANAQTKDGLFASLAILDEYAQARDTANKNGADLKNVLTTSMGPRKNPLTVIITTASDVIDGPCYKELEGVKKVLRGELENDTIFADLFLPDADDEESDPHTWAKVQPHLGVTVQPDFYEMEWGNAQLSAENMLAFRTKLLNIFTINEIKTWFGYKDAKQIIGNFNIDTVKGKPDCAVAFDLSVHDDFSAIAYTLYSKETKRFYSHVDYYFPIGALKGHPNERLYRLWHEQGYLKFCKGRKIDVRMLADDIIARSKIVNIIRIGYDGYKAQDLVNILRVTGGKNQLQPYGQTYGNFNLPVESFEMLVYDDPPKITLNDNPINVYCLTNCVLDEDHLENKKPLKISQYRKIDGVICVLMTLGQLYSYQR